ncbi:adenylate/guanylate cyclase domain-containing protein [Lyngbya aestuarii]|uniref:adenylate/guanylate cyclase domain-containing protein n=1 Tax=Lyngbya aestuarii TaxID=118322 RepID=UPI00403D5EF3
MISSLNKLISLLAPGKREYLVVDQEFKIIEASLGTQRFADCPNQVIQGKDVRLSFPELIGLENILINIIKEREASFEIKSIGRSIANSLPLYIDIYIIKHPYQESKKNQLIIFLEDITTRMLLEQKLVQSSNEKAILISALSTSKAYIDKIIASMGDALLVTNSCGVIKTVNEFAQTLFGYEQSELVGNSISMIISDQNLLVTEIQQNLSEQTDSLKYLEMVCRTKRGEKLEIAFSCSAIYSDHQNTASTKDIIYVGRDITERQRNQKRLSAQHITSKILSESATIAEAIPNILQGICQSLGWDAGEFWADQNKLNSISILLHCQETWSRSVVNTSELTALRRQTTLAPSSGLAAHVWATGSGYWIADVVNDTSFAHPESISLPGLRGAFGFPIQGDSEMLGVMIFFSREIQQRDEQLLQVMDAIGRQLGQFIKRKQAEEELRNQKEETDRLLLNILPCAIANRLKRGSGTIADDFAEVTVLFADIVSFTEFSAKISPTETVEMLNEIFSEFDQLAQQHGLEKIKTIGDAYMVVGGLPTPQDNHAEAIANMALDMQATIPIFRNKIGKDFSIRIGINTGPAVAGVIGLKKFSYDLWGDTVNVASRMESQGLAGQIQVATDCYERLKEKYLFKERGAIFVKGKGLMKTYLLMGKKD